MYPDICVLVLLMLFTLSATSILKELELGRQAFIQLILVKQMHYVERLSDNRLLKILALVIGQTYLWSHEN